MEKPKLTSENEKVRLAKLGNFDLEYFRQIGGINGWIALDHDFCLNPRYFTVLSDAGEKIGIVGVYDTEYEKNISHTVVDPKYRGQGLAGKFKEKLMAELDLPFLTLTIDLDNAASIRAAEKIPGIEKISDAAYEEEFHKAKYIQRNQKNQRRQSQ